MLNPRLKPVLSRFRCPECSASGTSIKFSDTEFICNECKTVYPVNDSIPVFLNRSSLKERDKELNSETGKAMVSEYHSKTGDDNGRVSEHKWFSFLVPPEIMYHPNPTMMADNTRFLFDHRGKETLVLNLGGGPIRYHTNEISLNLDTFLNVDILSDAHNISFMDNTFDSIVCNAVLEHVYDPEKVVSEMIRVTKPGGYVYAEIPFVFFFHGYPNDFKRYTREGLKRLFSELEDIQISITNGPVSSMLQSMNILFNLFIPQRLKFVRKGFNGLYRWILFPLKYLDIWLIKREESHILAGGFAVLGKKPDE